MQLSGVVEGNVQVGSHQLLKTERIVLLPLIIHSSNYSQI